MSGLHDFLAELSAAFDAPALLEPDGGALTFEVGPNCPVHLLIDRESERIVQYCVVGQYQSLADSVVEEALSCNAPTANDTGFTLGRDPRSGTTSLCASEFMSGFRGRVVLRRLCDMARTCEAWRDYFQARSDHPLEALPHLSEFDEDEEASGQVDAAFVACRSFIESEGISVECPDADSFTFVHGTLPFRCIRKHDYLTVSTTASQPLPGPPAADLMSQLSAKNFFLAGVRSGGAYPEDQARIGFYCNVRPADSLIEDFKRACVLGASDVLNLALRAQSEAMSPDAPRHVDCLWV